MLPDTETEMDKNTGTESGIVIVPNGYTCDGLNFLCQEGSASTHTYGPAGSICVRQRRVGQIFKYHSLLDVLLAWFVWRLAMNRRALVPIRFLLVASHFREGIVLTRLLNNGSSKTVRLRRMIVIQSRSKLSF